MRNSQLAIAHSRRSCSSQRASFPTRPGSEGGWGLLPEDCSPPPRWNEKRHRERGSKSQQSIQQQRSVHKSHPPRKENERACARSRTNGTAWCTCGLYRARMTPLPLGADWLTFELLHVHALYKYTALDPVVKICCVNRRSSLSNPGNQIATDAELCTQIYVNWNSTNTNYVNPTLPPGLPQKSFLLHAFSPLFRPTVKNTDHDPSRQLSKELLRARSLAGHL